MKIQQKVFCFLIVAQIVGQVEVSRAQDAIAGSFEKIYEKFSVSGKTVTLLNFYILELNCAPVEILDISITKQPEHGSLIVKDGKSTVYYVKDNPRSACNGKTVASKLVQYTS